MYEDFRNRGDHGRPSVPRPANIEPRIHTALQGKEKQGALDAATSWVDSLTGGQLGSWVNNLRKPRSSKK